MSRYLRYRLLAGRFVDRFFEALFVLVVVGALIVGAVKVYDHWHGSDGKACEHGESSIVVTLGKDGKMHTRGPFKTGCTP